MKNKLGYLIISLIMVVILNGCQLAQEDLAATKGQDKLIGVYITYESLDLFDMDAFLKDNFTKLSSGENVIPEVEDKYNDRLYASFVEKEMTDENGEIKTNSEYVFEGLEGIPMFTYTIADPVSGESYMISNFEDGIFEAKSSINCGDNEEGIELEGILYVDTNTKSHGVYVNPVYQSADDKVYLLSGYGLWLGEDQVEGAFCTHTISDSITVTENKKTITYNSTIKVSVTSTSPAEKVAISQMRSDSHVISRNEYFIDEMPEEIIPDNACEYLIIESYSTDINGEMAVERKLLSKEESSLDYFKKVNHGVLFKGYSSIKW